MNSLAFIVQARVGSTRLKNKIIRPFFDNHSILDIIINKLKQLNYPIIIATSDSVDNNSIEEIAKKNKVLYFRGSENDVLCRFIDAAEHFKVDKIIRICSDNPFIDLEALSELVVSIEKNKSTKIDYIGFKVGNSPSIKTHYGFWGEYVSLNALKRVRSFTKESLFHEHVTNYIYSNPDKFQIKWICTNQSLLNKDIRLTVDTKEDFENIKKIYSDISTNHNIERIIQYLDDNPHYYNSMRIQIDKNSK